MGFLLCEACDLLMSCLLPAHVWTLCLPPAGTCWTMESEQSRAEGGHELTIHAAGNFWSILFYLATLASLKAVWNLVFIVFWQRQQHLELFEYPLLQLHLAWGRVWLDNNGVKQMYLVPRAKYSNKNHLLSDSNELVACAFKLFLMQSNHECLEVSSTASGLKGYFPSRSINVQFEKRISIW